MNRTSQKTSAYAVRSLEKALDILELFTEHQELGTRETARMIGHNRSTVHRLLVTFEQRGYLVQNPMDGKFRLGMKFHTLGAIAVRHFDLRTHARPVMTALSKDLNESVYLLIQDSINSVVCIEEVLVRRALTLGPTLGMSTPIHAGAAGKCFLAQKPIDSVKQFLREHRLFPLTEHTITNPKHLLAEIEKVRTNGYALNDEESEIGIRYVAVPVYDHTHTMIAALNVGVPVVRLTEDKIKLLITKMKAAAAEIAEQFGTRLEPVESDDGNRRLPTRRAK